MNGLVFTIHKKNPTSEAAKGELRYSEGTLYPVCTHLNRRSRLLLKSLTSTVTKPITSKIGNLAHSQYTIGKMSFTN